MPGSKIFKKVAITIAGIEFMLRSAMSVRPWAAGAFMVVMRQEFETLS